MIEVSRRHQPSVRIGNFVTKASCTQHHDVGRMTLDLQGRSVNRLTSLPIRLVDEKTMSFVSIDIGCRIEILLEQK